MVSWAWGDPTPDPLAAVATPEGQRQLAGPVPIYSDAAPSTGSSVTRT